MRELAAAVAANPYGRKVLVCRHPAHGRELLRALALSGTSWLNVEVTTPRRLADELALHAVAERGLHIADEFDELALLDEAIDDVLQGSGGRLAQLSDAPGLRHAVARSIRALRLAGLDAGDLERVRWRDEDKRMHVARIMAGYERRLADAGVVDGAGILDIALTALESDAGESREDQVLIMPDQDARGLSGRFLYLLARRGAIVLRGESVEGLPAPAAPTLGLFSATSVAAELREVLRRVLAAGLQWDEVEIVASDPVAYGIALDSLAQRLDVPVTWSGGLPIVRTRPGRAVAKYLEWVERGLPADLLRQMLERGDIAAPAGSGTTGMALARRLRELVIARGREQYEIAFARAGDEHATLASIVRPLVDATPSTTDGDRNTTPAALARGVLTLLEHVPAHSAADATAKGRLRETAVRIERMLVRPATLNGAIAAVAAHLTGTGSTVAVLSGGRSSAGGHLHLSGLADGGVTGRRATFLVGLDSSRFPGAGGGDALLVDDDRRRLTTGQAVPALATAAERIEEKRLRFAALVSRLRGHVTFSYAAWDAAEARTLAPAPELLQVHRRMTGNATADYEALHDALAPAASAVPRGDALLDSDDVWLHSLARQSTDGRRGALLRGVTTVCAVHPHLGTGIAAWKARYRSAVPNAHLGIVAPRPSLDPRAAVDRVVSATELQTLGACPHRYLLRHVLRVRKPEDALDKADEWLSPAERGRFMHGVYDDALARATDAGVNVASDAFAALVHDAFDSRIAEMRARVPPPGPAIFDAEYAALLEDVRAFVAMVREDLSDDGRTVVALEKMFGDDDDPVVLPLPDGRSVRLRGTMDRVDRLQDGRLVVIDYKTGGALRYGGRNGVFDGGRRLQHVLYAEAAERLFGAGVARAEYHFPTRRSENFRARYERAALRDGLAIATDLLDLAAHGWFIPTNDPDDCRVCDYAAVCRVKIDAYDSVESKLAEWSRGAQGDAPDLIRRVRR